MPKQTTTLFANNAGGHIMLTIRQDTGINYNSIYDKLHHIYAKPECENMNLTVENTLFFDIETTGFAAKNTKLYLIGCLYADPDTEHLISIQWFLDDYDDEAKILHAFIDFSKDYKVLIHFNGQGFDIPYVEAKCASYNMDYSFDNFYHIDLYKHASRLKNLFKTENLKQKTMEQFFGLNREDTFSGGDLIAVYQEYMSTKDPLLLNFLQLHNYEDIKGMITILDILSYSAILDGAYKYNAIFIDISGDASDIPRREAIIEYILDRPVPKRVSFGYKDCYITTFEHKLKIKINIYTDELKYFYPNYKDYYYLPEEDMAVHKSVAFYVDKNYRVRAKAANCYSKKAGQFMPQYDEIVTPYFKKEYGDKTLYFEVTEDFLNSPDTIYEYGKHVVEWLMKVK